MLRRLEEELLAPETRSSPDKLADLLADDFIEFGRSGHVYDKRQTIEALAGEAGGPEAAARTAARFHVNELAEGVVLLTYRSARHEAGSATHALRSSIWAWREGRWQMVFHQGTPTNTSGGD
ncbi:DUF4440 domain-containing protein [Bosea eneae]|uniref:DUF4440 domain-containing protein n=1 Tax=Bosea eneae TaxID=151454 RepID=A0ABW0IN19_9HYPH